MQNNERDEEFEKFIERETPELQEFARLAFYRDYSSERIDGAVLPKSETRRVLRWVLEFIERREQSK